jgi:hypothetical protein
MTETETLFKSPMTHGDFFEMLQYQQSGHKYEDYINAKSENLNADQAKAKLDADQAKAKLAEKTSNTPTTYDLINGGIRQFLHRRAVQAPQVNIERHVFIQREIADTKNYILSRKIEDGARDAYYKMEDVTQKLKEHAYKPQARMNFHPQGADAFESPYSGEFQTAGKRSNMPDVHPSFQFSSTSMFRGRLHENTPEPSRGSAYVDFM